MQAAASGHAVRRGAVVAFLLLSGTAYTLVSKSLYQLQSQGRDGSTKHFAKPFFCALLMFSGMALCLPLAPLFRRLEAWLEGQHGSTYSKQALQQPLLGADGPAAAAAADAPRQRDRATRVCVLAIVPTAFSLTATLLKKVGLVFLIASVFQIMRSSEVVFAAALSSALLRPLGRGRLAGICLCVAGMALVAAASVLDAGAHADSHGHPGRTSRQALAGMLLVVAGEAVQAVQNVVEDELMTTLHPPAEPIKLVGLEGLYGAAAMAAVALPAAQLLPGPEGRGLHEDSLDTLAMLGHSGRLRAAAGAYVGLALVYNFFGMVATGQLGAVARTMLEVLRTLGVWLASLALLYAAPGLGLGERWAPHSWLQAVGFGVVVLGSLLYSRGEEGQYAQLLEAMQAPAAAAARLLRGRAARPPRIASPARIRTAYAAHRLPGWLTRAPPGGGDGGEPGAD